MRFNNVNTARKRKHREDVLEQLLTNAE